MTDRFNEAEGLPPICGVERVIGDYAHVSTRVTIRTSPNLVIVSQWGQQDGEVALTRSEVRRLWQIVEAQEFPENQDSEKEIDGVFEALEDKRSQPELYDAFTASIAEEIERDAERPVSSLKMAKIFTAAENYFRFMFRHGLSR